MRWRVGDKAYWTRIPTEGGYGKEIAYAGVIIVVGGRWITFKGADGCSCRFDGESGWIKGSESNGYRLGKVIKDLSSWQAEQKARWLLNVIARFANGHGSGAWPPPVAPLLACATALKLDLSLFDKVGAVDNG
jgi:hypothetical protein